MLPIFPPETGETQGHASGAKGQRHMIYYSELEPEGSEV